MAKRARPAERELVLDAEGVEVTDRISGKPAGAGCSQPTVSKALAVAIRFFVCGCQGGKKGKQSAAKMLRRVLVEEWSVADAAAEAGLDRKHAHRMVAEFRADLAAVCKAEGISEVELVMGTD